MRVAIVHDSVSDTDGPDARDVRVQARAVAGALEELGHPVRTLPCTLNLEAMREALLAFQAERVFNLVESLAGHGRLIHLVPACLDALCIPYTGAKTGPMFLTSHKVMAKERLKHAGLPTAEWVGPCPGPPARPETRADDWIIKSVWEHASIGLDEGAVVRVSEAGALWPLLAARALKLGGLCFAERYIEGREFNLSLLACEDGPQVLPPAEIRFSGYGAGRPRIVDYRAKWDESSFEYRHTRRTFDFEDRDAGLLDRLRGLALDCWAAFGLSGYARVDFRVDDAGRPWILEINANPCLSPDAGFAAALETAGIAYTEAIQRILADTHPGVDLPRAETSREPEVPVHGVGFRFTPESLDVARVRELVAITGFFSEEEAGVAGELVEERLDKGPASGYDFVMADHEGLLTGYACFGPIPCTTASFDLYWIAVHPEFQGRGLGRRLLRESERLIKSAGGRRVYVDTSRRAQYAGTRSFYESCGYRLETVLQDFYSPGDGKAVYCKVLV
ncbi:GNAT family N-acetyltransferase [Desulfococcus sp.]|uniref:GNAT family N-acetyltransferase n=1 Tax=Desulfococcus sp. TaxID=2025834 RepID=UPI0035937855